MSHILAAYLVPTADSLEKTNANYKLFLPLLLNLPTHFTQSTQLTLV